jgi:predicted transcriptional regulator
MPIDRRGRKQRLNKDPIARYLGELQALVMDFFWQHESATVNDVAAALSRRKLAYSTLLTVVTRLYTRGLLERTREGRSHRYRATKTRDAFLADLTDRLIDQVLEDFGDVAVARLDQRLEQLDPERLERLRKERRASS